MLRRDFILVQIEELGKVIAQLISQRNTDAARKIPELIQVAYDSLRIDTNKLMLLTSDEIRQLLNQEDGEGLRRMELAAKVLMEESFIRPEQQQAMLVRAKEILEYVQQFDNTFSIERDMLLSEISSLLVFE